MHQSSAFFPLVNTTLSTAGAAAQNGRSMDVRDGSAVSADLRRARVECRYARGALRAA
jgi:hypothetical protein